MGFNKMKKRFFNVNYWKCCAAAVIFLLWSIIGAAPVEAATSYTVDSQPTVAEGGFREINVKMTIKGDTIGAFKGDGRVDRVEFRLPSGFYFNTVGASVYGSDFDVTVQIYQGFTGAPAEVVSINPISSNTAGQYQGFELCVNKPSQDVEPQLIIYFNRIYIPEGTQGDVLVQASRSGNSAFSSGSFVIARASKKSLYLSMEKNVPLAPGRQVVGPIVVTENIPGAFQCVELTLPTGCSWVSGTAVISPSLGLSRDYDLNKINERDFNTSYENESRYGQSVLRVQLAGEPSLVSGALRIECGVELDETKASPGNVIVTVAGSSKPVSKKLTLGTYSKDKASLLADTVRTVYSGLRGQEISDFTIAEQSPGGLQGGGRSVSLLLPSWATWEVYPTISVVDSTELSVGDEVLPVGSDGHIAKFSIFGASQRNTAKIVLKDAKVSLRIDAPEGDLKITVGGTAGFSGEVVVGSVKRPVSVTSLAKPDLYLGKREQHAGDIEIKESEGSLLMTAQLWLEFPDSISLSKTPTVEVVGGNLAIGNAYLEKNNKRDRLVIPVTTASSSPGTIRVTNIYYDIGKMRADGDIGINVGGPAINEVRFPGHEWLEEVVNGCIKGAEAAQKSEPGSNAPGAGKDTNTTQTPTQPVQPVQPVQPARSIIFFLGEKVYRVNGNIYPMAIAPELNNMRVYVPLRYANQAFGIKDQNVFWDPDKNTALLINQNKAVKVDLKENAIYSFEKKLEADAPLYVKEGRIMVPIRSLSQAFGATLEWDPANGMVKIVYQP